MTSPYPSRRHSSHVLGELLLTSWLGCTLLIGLALTLINLRDHQQQIMRESDYASQAVAAILRTPLQPLQRQQLLEAYGQSSRRKPVEGMNVLLVVSRSGRIDYASKPTWRRLHINDPLFERMQSDDPDFQSVVDCFRRHRNDCMQYESIDWHLHLAGITVVRPLTMPAAALGLPRQPFLVLVNFDSGVLIGDVLQDLPILLGLSLLISSLFCACLWFLLAKRLLPQLLEASQIDALTQLMNRTSFMDIAMEVLAEAEERKGELVFVILDLDHFKCINDTYGHGCGDAALASVGKLLLTVTRPDDLVCRFGGEEFAMLLATSRETGSKVLERLRLQLEMNRLLYDGNRIPLTVSIGAAASCQCGYNLDFLYNAADKALYNAKKGGRNRVEWNGGELVTRLPVPLNRQL